MHTCLQQGSGAAHAYLFLQAHQFSGGGLPPAHTIISPSPSMADWNAACACGRLSLKVGVIMPFSTLKGSGCRWMAATWRAQAGWGPGVAGWVG